MFDLSNLFFVLSYLLIFLGIVGALVPILPGPLLIWLGALVWAWADGFARIGWPTLLVLAVLTVIAWGADLALSFLGSKRSGAGWKSIGVSILGGLLGAILLSSVPVVGTFIGAAIGSISALWLMEYRRAQVAPGNGAMLQQEAAAPGASNVQENRAAATRAVKGYVGGFLMAMAVEFIISLMMLTIFAWQAFL
ncbi:MAG: DUF456 domain-containing protein [Caldilineaceae bacterium]|nr:DUF456 domain-containing protein [Caldilineaceae bacterium]